MPERVGKKRKARFAYPIGGEYVVDVDANLHWRPHTHYIGPEGVCGGCLSLARDATLAILRKIEDNYSDVHVVFSGRKGFHCHILDFDLRDWTYYNDRTPLKSHEAARFKFTKHLKELCGGFDRYHFIHSCDVTRIITFPESLNGDTGLISSYLGKTKDFEELSVHDIVMKSKATRFLYGPGFTRLSEFHSHPELEVHVQR